MSEASTGMLLKEHLAHADDRECETTFTKQSCRCLADGTERVALRNSVRLGVLALTPLQFRMPRQGKGGPCGCGGLAVFLR